VVEAHGSFYSAKCVKCGAKYSAEVVRVAIDKGDVPHCAAPAPAVAEITSRWLRHHPEDADPAAQLTDRATCDGFVKPDIVFFKESMPRNFFDLLDGDMQRCDLLLVLGTSLKVYPFAGSYVLHVHYDMAITMFDSRRNLN